MTKKGKIFRAYSAFVVVSDIGSNFIGRWKGWLPDVNKAIVELGAFTILLTYYHIQIPTWVLIAFILGQEYFWMLVYFFGGLKLKKAGLIRAQNEFAMQHIDDFNPFDMEVADTLEEICKKLGIESRLELYKDMKAKRATQLIKENRQEKNIEGA